MRIGRCFSGSDGRGGEEMSSNLRGEMGVLGGFVWMILALGEFGGSLGLDIIGRGARGAMIEFLEL